MKLAVIIPAAGASTRFSAGSDAEIKRSKLDEDLGGIPVLHRTVDLFVKRDDVHTVIVAGPYDAYDAFMLRHADKLGLLGCKVCRGGKTHRWETVKAALEHVPEDCTHVAVHDAARPAAPVEMIDRVFAAAQKYGAVIPGVDVPDTLKRVAAKDGDDGDIDPLDRILGDFGRSKTPPRVVTETVSRDGLVCVQTPQVFTLALIKKAYAQKDLSSTDDAGLVEKLGEAVHVVDGDPRNIKITRPVDLHTVRLIMNLKGPAERPVHKRF